MFILLSDDLGFELSVKKNAATIICSDTAGY